MKGFLRLLLVTFLAFSLIRCATGPSEEEGAVADEFATEATTSDTASNAGTGSVEDELNQAEGVPSKPAEPEAAPAENVAAAEPSKEAPVDEFAQFEEKEAKPQPESAPAPEAQPPAQAQASNPPPEEAGIPPQVDMGIEPRPPAIAPTPIVETKPPP